MRRRLVPLIAASALAAGCATTGNRQSVVVEAPAQLPAIAREGGADMFLHDTSHGHTLLYIESADGRSMSILDVSDPAHISAVGRVSVQSQAPYFYVKDVNQVKTLVRFGNSPGYGLLDFSRDNRPTVVQTAALTQAERVEPIDDRSLLVATTDRPLAPAVVGATQHYEVLDTSRAGNPATLGDISGVRRRLAKADTGTTFLLADNGVTVIRNLGAEEAKALHESADRQ